MKIRTAIIISTVSALIIPNFLYAATLGLGSLVELANTLASGVVTSLGYLFFALAVVAFLWGMVQFIWNARNGDSGKGMENGKQFMLWGLIALFVMFSVWGIITFAQRVFNINGQTSIVIPNIQLLGSSPAANTGTPSCGYPMVSDGKGGCILINSNPAGTTACVAPEVVSSADSSKCVKPSSPCTVTVCTTPPTCQTVQGTYDASGSCVQNQTAPTSNTANPTSKLCVKKDANGKAVFVTGTPNDLGQCVNQ